jgi:hypothetical protein
MKRSEMSVGMSVAVKKGYDVHQAEVVSVQPHENASRYERGGQPRPGGNGVLVKFSKGYREGELFAVLPRMVLGEWDAYQAEAKARGEAFEKSYQAAQARQVAREQAEMDAMALAKEHAIPASAAWASSAGVVLPVEVFTALVAALPQGYTYTAQEGDSR